VRDDSRRIRLRSARATSFTRVSALAPSVFCWSRREEKGERAKRWIAASAILWIFSVSEGVGQDTITVLANNPPVWGAESVVKEVVKIGCLEGPEECTFGNIDWVAVRSDWSVFVADRFGPTIKKFGADGSFLGRVGGVGEGPGEYRRSGSMTVLPSGNVAMWDHPNQRITVFDSTGKYVRSFRATGRRPSAPLGPTSTGSSISKPLARQGRGGSV